MGCQSSSVPEKENVKNNHVLLEPIKLGSIQLKNRVIMASLTRCRGDRQNGVPTDLMVEYYGQRASFGAILTEGSQISPISNTYPGSGGIYSKEQIEGWKKVTKRVHENGGKIILQIWHSGRAVVSEFIDGATPIAPSPIPISSPHPFSRQSYPVPKEMTKDDIKEVLEQFRQGALNAKEAGFDGLELHGANGFLVDQFLKDSTNNRNDEYGGSVQNRIRFCLEALDVLISVYGSDKVGIKLSPTGRYHDIYDSNPLELMKQLFQELEKKKLAFVEVKRHGNSEVAKSKDGKVDQYGRILPQVQIPNFFDSIRSLYSGLIICNDGIDERTAIELVKQKTADCISFGTLSISNPDLPERFRNGWELTYPNPSTFYTSGPTGYIDYNPHK